jgi:hypothetical protein
MVGVEVFLPADDILIYRTLPVFTISGRLKQFIYPRGPQTVLLSPGGR